MPCARELPASLKEPYASLVAINCRFATSCSMPVLAPVDRPVNKQVGSHPNQTRASERMQEGRVRRPGRVGACRDMLTLNTATWRAMKILVLSQKCKKAARRRDLLIRATLRTSVLIRRRNRD